MKSETGGRRTALAARFLRLGVLAAAGLLLAQPAALAFQDKKRDYESLEEVDPHTQGKPELLQALGYESLGPFYWADAHSSDDIETLLGGIPMVWVETPHFRIGSNLPTYTVANDKIEKAKIKDELKTLKKTLKRIKPTTRELDRWMRLHLYALRLESLYEDFCKRFGVTDEDFPETEADRRAQPYMGKGKWLGAKGKFLVLLMEDASGFARYTERYFGSAAPYSMRYSFPISGSFFYGTCSSYLIGEYENDTALHCNVTTGLVLIFFDAFRAHDHSLPMWWRLGLASWYTRNLDERFNAYGVNQTGLDKAYRWQPRVYGRVKNEYFPKAAEMMAWNDPDELDEAAHMMMWSRVDFLMSRDPESAAGFLMAITEPLPRGSAEERARIDQERQFPALKEHFGLTPEEFDEQWAEYVLKKYDKR